MALQLSEKEIDERSINLPAFPRVVNDILATLDDENANLGALVRFVERDPVITARIISIANSAAMAGRHSGQLRDVNMAVSLIGLARIREIVLAVSLAEFATKSRMSSYFWEHSVAVAITAQELGRFTHISPDYALVAGLLHDIGQLWMARFYPLEFQMVRATVNCSERGIIEVERQYFGMDHCQIGGILATRWGLPDPVVMAVSYHHDPSQVILEQLADLIHVAEVFSNALDLTGREDNLVTNLSEDACQTIGLRWDVDLHALFGKIEARSEHACRVFR
jgi:putative nucleotidyltransferase with HDIG domain